MESVSVVICCADVADTLEAACRSVAWSDDLVIVKLGSADATPEIARRFASRYVVEPWRGYTEQKRFGTTLCRHDWVLVLDGDEECSTALADEIARLTGDQQQRYDVFLMRRRTYVMGRYVRAFNPDWQSRLIHRSRCRWADEALHDNRLPSHPSRVAKLDGWLEHKRHSRRDFGDYFNGALADRRLRLLAEHLYRQGRRCTWADLLFRPAWAFVKIYVLKRGFRDGSFGLLIAQRAATATQLKYAALWTYQKQAANRRGP